MSTQTWGTYANRISSNTRGSSYANRLPSLNKPSNVYTNGMISSINNNYGNSYGSSNLSSGLSNLGKNTQSQINNNFYNHSNSLSYTTKPKGLENLTNTCYMSSCLQVMIRLLPQTLDSGNVTKAFFKLKNTHSRSDYQAFKYAAQKQIWLVKGWGQQDAQQFLISFLEVLNKQNKKSIKSGKVNLDYDQKQSISKNFNLFVENMKKIENSQIINLFYGDFLRQFICPKGHIKHKFQRFQNLSLYFPENKVLLHSASHGNQNPIKLQSMLDKQLDTQTIDGLLCQTCKQKCKFQKKTILYTLPRILIIHFARFKRNLYKQQKINTQVQYDQTLQIFQKQTDSLIKYKLTGIVHHFGTLNGGHYFSDVKVDGQWYQCNDDRITNTQVSSKGNISKFAYILFYQRQSH